MRVVLFAVLVVAGCATGTVRQSDVDSWRGAHRDELAAHPLFSTVPKQVETLSDGAELWTYSNCITRNNPVSCKESPLTGRMNCSGGEGRQACCYNQFLVRGDAVESYRLSGRCRTDCSVRPASRACGSAVAAR